MAEQPPSLHQILHDCPDQSEPHLKAFLTLLGKENAAPWRLVAEAMMGNLAEAIREQKPHVRRADLRDAFETIADAAGSILKEMTQPIREQQVIDALAIYAPSGPRDVDDVTGFAYLNSLQQRARQVAAAIPRRPGSDTIAPFLGRPAPRRLCAVMTREAFRHAKGKALGERSPKALDACASLWASAERTGETDATFEWEFHLRDARRKEGSSGSVERSIALSCLAHLRETRQESA